MPAFVNDFVNQLNKFTTVSARHEAAFDEYMSADEDQETLSLRIETGTEDFVRKCIDQPKTPSIILTGNAGDGKTYLCRQIVTSLTNQTTVDWEDGVVTIPLPDNGELVVVKDLSELGEELGSEILEQLAESLKSSKAQKVFLIAANEGRLRALLSTPALESLLSIVEEQLREPPTETSKPLLILNLNAVFTSEFVGQVLRYFSSQSNWENCANCPIFNHCPIRKNAEGLRNEYIQKRVEVLYSLLEDLNIHITIRDLLIHLAYMITGGQTCERLQDQRFRVAKSDQHKYLYFENAIGNTAPQEYRRKVLVLSELERLQLGTYSYFDADDFIVNGDSEDPEFVRLFGRGSFPNAERLDQRRREYLRGLPSKFEGEDDTLITWLPFCRRKLFFEWNDTEKADRLLPFRFFPEYQLLLEEDFSIVDDSKRKLIVGLNRAFSGLFLSFDNCLYVTSQYSHAVEQPVPVIKVEIPSQSIQLTTSENSIMSKNRNKKLLEMVVSGAGVEPITVQLNLLRFEYLMRLSRGGTYNILSEECALFVRDLKDEILSHFSQDESGQVKFFVSENNRYAISKVGVDNRGRIRV